MFVDHGGDSAAWRKTAAEVGPSTSGQFVYDKHQMNAIIKAWTDLAQDYRNSVIEARSMVGITGPGKEYASKSHAVDANASGEAYITSLKSCADYCRSQVAKYQKVLGVVVNTDEESHHKMKQSSSPLDGGI